MIVLDTNVVSELMKPAPNADVIDWVAAQSASSLYITSITQAEILHGIGLLPSGKRRAALETSADAMFRQDFSGRILPFGSDAAQPYARIAVDRRRIGRPISQFDAQIAAIARAAGAAIATRDIAGYAGCGVRLIDPWDG